VTDVPAELAEALRDRYPIERRLGSGGMAAVYLARDLKHDRLVALKVLRPELAATLGAERFEREIRFSARLQHPHILTVLDSGQAAGHLWFTMPYVRGESLRERIRRQRQLTVDEALRITQEALQALAYAHAEGVVHRDIKPENILLGQDGSTLVADFGIARTLAGDDAGLTESGLVVGSPAYMSPEQATGGAVDGRTDLYSLACVCYEMLAGEPPFTGTTAQAVIAKRLSGRVPDVKRLRPTVPTAVDRALRRAMAPAPADRFATAADFIRAMRRGAPAGPTGVRPTAALAVAVLLGLSAFLAWGRRGAAGPGTRVLAVLPFENMGDSADGYFADGVTDEVRTRLSQVPGIEVIARGSSNQYRGTSKPLQQIAQELGVDYLLTATVRWAKLPSGASRVRVIPELVDLRRGGVPRTSWEETFDAALTDVFQVQADIATKVAGALHVALADRTRQRLAARPTQDLRAYDALLRGDRLLITEARTDLASDRSAADAYAEAVERDSTFALAWARLARAELLRYDNGEDPAGRDSVAQAARRAADRAVRLAPDLPEAYYALALTRSYLDLDPAAALDALEHAHALAPTDTDVLSTMGSVLASLGRNEEAVARLSEAARLDPRSLLVARRYSSSLVGLDRFRQADSVAGAALQLAPDNLGLVASRTYARLLVGDTAGVRVALREALRHVQPAEFFRNVDPGVLFVDDSLEKAALSLPPSAFADDRAEGLLQQASLRWIAGEYAAARASADSAIPLLEAQRALQPADPRVPALLMDAYALARRRAEGLAEAERWGGGGGARPKGRRRGGMGGVRAPLLDSSPGGRAGAVGGAYAAGGGALARPTPKSRLWIGWMWQRATIALIADDAGGAIALLDTLLTVPGGTTRAFLRVHPMFDPLRHDPRFLRLVSGN
jgi:serine/threonine-protein kinase